MEMVVFKFPADDNMLRPLQYEFASNVVHFRGKIGGVVFSKS